MSATVRPPAVAGTFYPGNRAALRDEISAHLAAADPIVVNFPLRILIVPHAGYVYSGPVAATGYQLLQGNSRIKRIVMLGPSHYVRFSGLALPGVEQLETPLGLVAVDTSGAAQLVGAAQITESVAAHGREHSLEVQLPFLQTVMPGVPVIPLLTGSIEAWEGAMLVEPLLDEATLLLVSSDLSHYHDADTARRLDAATAAAIVALEPDALEWESACGRTGVQIALHIARQRRYQVDTLDLRNSADTAGTPERVVGYGTFAIGG